MYRRHLHRFWASLDCTDPPDRAEWENEARVERDVWRETIEDVESLGRHMFAQRPDSFSPSYIQIRRVCRIRRHRMLRKADLHDGKMQGNRHGGRR